MYVIFRDSFSRYLNIEVKDRPRDSQESSPIPQFKSISSLALRFLYSPTLTSIRDHWKNHSFDLMDLCWQIMSLLFNMLFTFKIIPVLLLICWDGSSSSIYQPGRGRISQHSICAFNNFPFSAGKPLLFPSIFLPG